MEKKEACCKGGVCPCCDCCICICTNDLAKNLTPEAKKLLAETLR